MQLRLLAALMAAPILAGSVQAQLAPTITDVVIAGPVCVPDDGTPVTYNITISGVGTGTYAWSVLDDDGSLVDDTLQDEMLTASIVDGPWIENYTVVLWCDTSLGDEVVGPDGCSDEGGACNDPAEVYVLVESGLGVDLAESARINVCCCAPATATAYNGSGVNPQCLSAVGVPSTGTTWSMQVHGVPANFGFVLGYRSAGTLITPYGELLVSGVHIGNLVSLPDVNGVTTLFIQIPTDPGFVGHSGFFQGGSLVPPGGVILCNAIQATIGG